MRDAHASVEAIKQAEPEYIFHLAAQSFVPESWISPADVFDTNVKGTVNLLEAVRMSGLHPVIQIAGSSEEYGCPPSVDAVESEVCEIRLNHLPDKVFKLPITEDSPFAPLSPYAVSKVAEDRLGSSTTKAGA